MICFLRVDNTRIVSIELNRQNVFIGVSVSCLSYIEHSFDLVSVLMWIILMRSFRTVLLNRKTAEHHDFLKLDSEIGP